MTTFQVPGSDIEQPVPAGWTQLSNGMWQSPDGIPFPLPPTTYNPIGNDYSPAPAGTPAGQGTEYIWTQNGPVLAQYTPGAGSLGAPSSAIAPGGAATTSSGQSSPQTGADQAAQASAIGVLSNELTSWGFGADAISWATSEVQSNKSVDQILFDLRQQPFYVNSIFGQTNAARTAAGLPVMNETDILNYKDAAEQIARSAGLPQGFMTDQELVSLMGADVSASELSQRVTQEYVNAAQALPVVRDEMARMYGLSPDQITPGGLAAYYLDPTKALPVLHQQLQAATIGASAIQAGFGQIDRSYAEGLASQGVTADTAKTGFSNVARESQFYGQLPGQGTPLITSAQALGAEFDKNAADITAVNQASAEARAPFQGGGRFAEGTGGVSGLGRAQSA